MSAGKNAIPLIEGNKKWKDTLPGFICNCGHSGKGHELLCEGDELLCGVLCARLLDGFGIRREENKCIKSF